MSVETILNYISYVLWAILILIAFFVKDSVKIRSVPVRNPFIRAVLAFFAIPIIGGILAVIGLVGWFMLLPILAFF